MSKLKSKPSLASLDMDSRIEGDDYEDRLAKAQTKLVEIQQAYLYRGHNAVVVFEGWDAAGKGGAIRRMSDGLDPRGFKVWPIAAPTPADLERHYLARFWERLPGKGAIAVFDRSWYGRVLVERVEGFASPKEWKRSYDEINDFERTLADSGARIVKLFLYITPEEQLKRFIKRLEDPLKRWKLSYEDFRNRGKWAEYEEAADEMLAKTSTKDAAWTLVPANHKKFARITAIETVVERLADGVDLSPRPLDEKVAAEARKLLDEMKTKS